MNENTELKIEKGVPIPIGKTHITGMISTMRKMEVGDSVSIPAKKRASWSSCAKSANIKIVTRKISDTETRVWRVA